MRTVDDMGIAPKRIGPSEVVPVQDATRRFEVIHWGRERGLGQNGGYIAATDLDGREPWILKVYDVNYDPSLEEDVQDVFIVSMVRAGPDALEIEDERGRRYLVNVATCAVRRV